MYNGLHNNQRLLWTGCHFDFNILTHLKTVVQVLSLNGIII